MSATLTLTAEQADGVETHVDAITLSLEELLVLLAQERGARHIGQEQTTTHAYE